VKSEKAEIMSEEISARDVAIFLRNNMQIVLYFVISGFLVAVAYIILMPSMYEAKWQIQMAQFGEQGSVETPIELIQRLRVPTAYSMEVRQSCNVSERKGERDFLGGTLRADVQRNVANTVEMKVVAISPDLANRCADSIVNMIVEQQRKLLDDRLSVTHELISENQKIVDKERLIVEKLLNQKTDGVILFAKLVRINSVLERLDNLQEEMMLSIKFPTKLTYPIYVNKKPVSPKVDIVFILGGLLGLVLGLLYALGKNFWRKADK
jgi:LPS O-antigen subunit length determinant protein (WzzB/FepE family)